MDIIIVKKWWMSKTLWANILVIIIGLLTWISGQIQIGLPITLAGILNAILRIMTNEGIEFKE